MPIIEAHVDSVIKNIGSPYAWQYLARDGGVCAVVCFKRVGRCVDELGLRWSLCIHTDVFIRKYVKYMMFVQERCSVMQLAECVYDSSLQVPIKNKISKYLLL